MKTIYFKFDLDTKQTPNKEKLGLIIESGFKIFVMLKRYLEIEPSANGEDEICFFFAFIFKKLSYLIVYKPMKIGIF